MHFHLFLNTRCVAYIFALALSLTIPLAFSANINCGETPIRLAFYNFGFLFFNNEKSVAEGIDKDFVDELIKRSGCKFDTRVMDRARIWENLANGSLDMSVSGIQNAERDRFAWFATYLVMKNYAILNSEVAKKVHNADDFLAKSDLKFGVVRAFKHGTAQDQWLEKLRAQHRVEESADAETIFRKLKDHKIDAVFSQPPVYLKNLNDLDIRTDVAIQDWTPDEKGVQHGLILAKSRFSETDAEQWRTLISEMRADGTLKQIISHYLPITESLKMLHY